MMGKILAVIPYLCGTLAFTTARTFPEDRVRLGVAQVINLWCVTGLFGGTYTDAFFYALGGRRSLALCSLPLGPYQ